jgi:hypothetical protein
MFRLKPRCCAGIFACHLPNPYCLNAEGHDLFNVMAITKIHFATSGGLAILAAIRLALSRMAICPLGVMKRKEPRSECRGALKPARHDKSAALKPLTA